MTASPFGWKRVPEELLSPEDHLRIALRELSKTSATPLPPAESFVLEETVPNPWNQLLITDGGLSLPALTESMMKGFWEQGVKRDCKSRNHHYVAQAYQKGWSRPGGLVTLGDLSLGTVREVFPVAAMKKKGLYRVRGPEGQEHNQIEAMLSVVDGQAAVLRQRLTTLQEGDDIGPDVIVLLSLVLSLQILRTPQYKRLMSARSDWRFQQHIQKKHPQIASEVIFSMTATNEFHVETLLKRMWGVTDELLFRHPWIVEDSKGRFMASDSPVLLPQRFNGKGMLEGGAELWWPLSPHRCVKLDMHHTGAKFNVRKVTGQEVKLLEEAVFHGSERFVLLPAGAASGSLPKRLRRPQLHITCTRLATGAGCTVRFSEYYGTGPKDDTCSRHARFLAPESHA